MCLDFKSISEKIENYLLPSQCAVCGNKGQILCPSCRARLPRLAPRCPNCGQKSILGLFCLSCQKATEQYYFDGVMSLSTYENSGLKPALQVLKYQGGQSIGVMLGKMLGRLISTHWRQASADLKDSTPIIIPLPLHPRRERERGYNQALLIAQGVSLITHWPINHGLRRLSYQSPSAHLNYQERQQQTKFFIYRGSDLVGRNVILVDDIITTGATVQAASLALKQAGVKKLIIAVIAESR